MSWCTRELNFNSIPFDLAQSLEEQGSSFCSSKLVCSSWPERALACVNTGDSTFLELGSWRITCLFFFSCVLPLFCISWNINKPVWSNWHRFPISAPSLAVMTLFGMSGCQVSESRSGVVEWVEIMWPGTCVCNLFRWFKQEPWQLR